MTDDKPTGTSIGRMVAAMLIVLAILALVAFGVYTWNEETWCERNQPDRVVLCEVERS